MIDIASFIADDLSQADGNRLTPDLVTSPQPTAGFPSFSFVAPEVFEILERKPSVGMAETPLDDLSVDKEVALVDISQQPAVPISEVMIKLQSDLSSHRESFPANAEASFPKYSTGLLGWTVSGVSTPISPTRSSLPW